MYKFRTMILSRQYHQMLSSKNIKKMIRESRYTKEQNDKSVKHYFTLPYKVAWLSGRAILELRPLPSLVIWCDSQSFGFWRNIKIEDLFVKNEFWNPIFDFY